jgi:hypothetical protein
MSGSILISAPQFWQVGHSFSMFPPLLFPYDCGYKTMGEDFGACPGDVPEFCVPAQAAGEGRTSPQASISKFLYNILLFSHT